MNKYSYSSFNGLAKQDKKLYFPGIYDFTLNEYDTTTQQHAVLTVPSENSSLDATWGKKNFVEKDRRKIKDQLHLFRLAFPFDNKLLLFEYCRDKEISNGLADIIR